MTQEIEVLLVEDNPNDAEITIRALKKSHLANRVLHVKDGDEALDFLFSEGVYEGRKLDRSLKVILLDLKMPRLNGLEVLLRIKGDERTKKIPVVVLTSSNEEPDIKKCFELGVNNYLVKPVEIEQFHKAISELGLFWLIVNQSPL